MRPADLDDLRGLQAAAGCRVPAPGRWGLQHAVGSCWRRGSEADPGSAGPLPQSVLPPVSQPRAVGTTPPVVGAGRRHPRVGRAPRRQHVRIRGREQRPPRVGRGPGAGQGGPARRPCARHPLTPSLPASSLGAAVAGCLLASAWTPAPRFTPDDPDFQGPGLKISREDEVGAGDLSSQAPGRSGPQRDCPDPAGSGQRTRSLQGAGSRLFRVGGPRDSRLRGLPRPPHAQPVTPREAEQTWWGLWRGDADGSLYLKSSGSHTRQD